MSQPLVSVVVPLNNGGQYLEITVESISTPSYQNIELIFVEDDSSDTPKVIIKNLMKRKPRIKSFYSKNTDVAKACNDSFFVSNLCKTSTVKF